MDKIRLFENNKIRTAWDEETEEWYFSVVDAVSVLTDSSDGRKYWNKLKQRLKDEGNELVTNCHQLKMTAADVLRAMHEKKLNKIRAGRLLPPKTRQNAIVLLWI